LAGNPHEKHRSRVRLRFSENGLDGFAHHEVLELLLYYCYPRQDTNEIAHRMLREFGSLSNLFEAEVDVLMARLGCSENIAVLLNLVPALTRRYFQDRWQGRVTIDDPRTAGEYCIGLFAGYVVERFYVISLDMQNRLIATTLISEGTVDEAAYYPREIAKAALHNHAGAIILTHNHPGGNLRPSQPDLEVTRRISDGLQFVGVPVLDHIIVAGDKYYSMAARANEPVSGRVPRRDKLLVAGYD